MSSETWQSVYLRMISECQKKPEALTDFDRSFLSNVKLRIEKGIPLTVNQIPVLENIHEKLTKRK